MDEQFQKDYERFKSLSFDDFRKLAIDDSLSPYQKIGFPDEYRKEKEHLIFNDIVSKLDLKDQKNKIVLDIGCGCSDLAHFIVNISKESEFKLLLADSEEMLGLLPDEPYIEKFSGYFPDQTSSLINQYIGQIDYIVCYSIFHYVFYNTCVFKFLDIAVSLLKPGGKLLIGDIPNINKRKRFFSTEQGIRFHQTFTGTNTIPDIQHLVVEPTQIDDGVIFSILQRYR